MGFLTTITIHNDAQHAFKKDPEKFAKTIFDGIIQAQRANKQVDVPFNGYANYINIQPPRHADAETIYLHTGNGVINMNPWNQDFEDLYNYRPELVKDYIKKINFLVKEMKEKVKEFENKK